MGGLESLFSLLLTLVDGIDIVDVDNWYVVVCYCSTLVMSRVERS